MWPTCPTAPPAPKTRWPPRRRVPGAATGPSMDTAKGICHDHLISVTPPGQPRAGPSPHAWVGGGRPDPLAAGVRAVAGPCSWPRRSPIRRPGPGSALPATREPAGRRPLGWCKARTSSPPAAAAAAGAGLRRALPGPRQPLGAAAAASSPRRAHRRRHLPSRPERRIPAGPPRQRRLQLARRAAPGCGSAAFLALIVFCMSSPAVPGAGAPRMSAARAGRCAGARPRSPPAGPHGTLTLSIGASIVAVGRRHRRSAHHCSWLAMTQTSAPP